MFSIICCLLWAVVAFAQNVGENSEKAEKGLQSPMGVGLVLVLCVSVQGSIMLYCICRNFEKGGWQAWQRRSMERWLLDEKPDEYKIVENLMPTSACKADEIVDASLDEYKPGEIAELLVKPSDGLSAASWVKCSVIRRTDEKHVYDIKVIETQEFDKKFSGYAGQESIEVRARASRLRKTLP